MIYRDIINYTTIIMKNKSKNIFKKTKNIFENSDNILLESSNNNENSKKSINSEFQNSNRILSSNELSLLIFSSNKDTNKFKRDALFGNLLSKDKIKFNSIVNDSNSFQYSNIYHNLENNLSNNKRNFINYLTSDKNKFKNKGIQSVKDKNYNTTIKRDYNNLFDNQNDYSLNDYLNLYQNDEIIDNNKNLNNYFTSEKNKLKNNNSQINYLSSIENKNYNTTIKRDYNNLFDNENNFSLNDYLNLYQNDENENIDNNFSNINVNEPKEPNSPFQEFSKVDDNMVNANKSPKSNQIINKNKKLETITEERKKEYKKKSLMNEELFNTRIKEKISKIKDDIIINNNLKQKNEDHKKNIKKNKYINTKLKKDKYIDYYELLSKELEQRDESKELENIFSEFFTEIKFKFWIQASYDDFIYSLNNCQIYNLIKLKNIGNSNFFDELISNMELSNNTNISVSGNNSYLYNSKSELLREGSHSINDSHSSQTIENQIEKNIPLISKFPKLMIPQSIIPEESSNFLYSNNDYILNKSLGEVVDENNFKSNLMEVQELEEEKNILYEENIKKELLNIGNNEEININDIYNDLNSNNIFDEEKHINEKDIIKEYKAKIFYDILLISQSNNINISQENPFGKIIKIV